jgi:LysR family transcriptional regulator, transcriptional activator for bauABCD operon
VRRLSSIDLRLLKIFAVVVDCNGFQRAQLALNIAQSTLSSHIANLEAKLGSRLCERGRGGFRLTDAGRETYDAIVALLRSMEAFESSMARVHSGKTGALRIGAIDTIVTSSEVGATQALRAFCDMHPETSIDIEIIAPADLEKSLLEGRRDVVIGPMSQAVPSISYQEIFTEEHHLYCGCEHPWFARSDSLISTADLLAARLSVRSYRYFDDIFRFGKVTASAMASNMEAQTILILSGRFVGFLPDHAARPYILAEEMRAIKPREWSLTSRFLIAYLRGSEKRELKREFVRTLLDVVSERQSSPA